MLVLLDLWLKISWSEIKFSVLCLPKPILHLFARETKVAVWPIRKYVQFLIEITSGNYSKWVKWDYALFNFYEFSFPVESSVDLLGVADDKTFFIGPRYILR